MRQNRPRRQARHTVAAQQARNLERTWLVVAGVAIGLIAIAGLLFFRSGVAPSSAPRGVRSFGRAAQTHTTDPVSYPQTPPVGGPHAPVWQNCGFYTTPLPNERAVHSMQHGAVWVTYDPAMSTDRLDALQRLIANRTYVLVSPFPGIPSPLVASAWGLQLRVDNLDDPALEQFIRAYRNGPQTPEPGAPCTGGTSGTASDGG